MSAVLQFEFDKKRVVAMTRQTRNGNYDEPHSAWIIAHEIIRAALQDVFDNGGTLVVVVGKDKITAVQRAEAEEI